MKNAILSTILAITVATFAAGAASAYEAKGNACTSDMATCEFINQLIKQGS